MVTRQLRGGADGRPTVGSARYGAVVAYDEVLADRVRDVLEPHVGTTERKMFGGVAFMFHGNMAVGILGDELMVRVPKERYEATLTEPHVRVMDFTGRPMRGFVVVGPDGIAEDGDLAAWVDRGMSHAGSLPPK